MGEGSSVLQETKQVPQPTLQRATARPPPPPKENNLCCWQEQLKPLTVWRDLCSQDPEPSGVAST